MSNLSDAVVLAAGKGTRLQPLTLFRPKALMPLVGQPMLDWALATLAKAGARRVLVNAWHHADQMLAYASTQQDLDVETVVERGPEPFGTGGGLKNLQSRLGPHALITNADVLCTSNLSPLRSALRHASAALLLRDDAHDAERYGAVGTDAQGRVVKLSNLATDPSALGQTFSTHFTGLHALHTDVLDLIADTSPSDIVRTAYRALFDAHKLAGVRSSGLWLDIGDPQAYLNANLYLLTADADLPFEPTTRAAYAAGPRGVQGDPPRGVRVGGPVWIGPDTHIATGARIGCSIIGARARISSQASLHHVVVWDGVSVPDGVWSDGIWHDGGFLPVSAACALDV